MSLGKVQSASSSYLTKHNAKAIYSQGATKFHHARRNPPFRDTRQHIMPRAMIAEWPFEFCTTELRWKTITAYYKRSWIQPLPGLATLVPALTKLN